MIVRGIVMIFRSTNSIYRTVQFIPNSRTVSVASRINPGLGYETVRCSPLFSDVPDLPYEVVPGLTDSKE